MNNQEYKEWEKEVPFLASLPVRNPYTVPERYFTTAHEDAVSQLSITLYAGKNPHTGFSVPEHYFEFLSDQVMARVTAESFRSKESGFSLPAGYFEQLSDKIMQKATATATPVKEAKVIRLWSSDLMKYASAACVILVTAATLFFNQQQYKLDQSSTADMYSGEAYKEQMLYDIDEDVIIEHIQSTSNTTASAVKAVPQEQLEAYILDNYSSNDIAQGM